MATPYIGEIRIFGGNFPPQGWAFCDGSLLAISENDALFNLIGTTYGGNGTNTFALPDLRGRVAVHQGSNGSSSYVIGQQGGGETVTLATGQLPAHTHQANGGPAGTTVSPSGNFWSTDPAGNTAAYASSTPDSKMNAGALSSAGGSQPHDNMSPYLVTNYIISLFGIYPSRS
jgi:microcystin-dependent protein